jgi:tetratricopeptide (TPR) repeat protein
MPAWWADDGDADPTIETDSSPGSRAQRIDEAAEAINRSASLWRDGRRPEGEQLIQRALEQHPDDDRLWRQFGLMQHDLGDPAAAIRALQHALELDPERAANYASYGVCLVSAGDLPAALDAYRRSLQLDPEDADALLEYGALTLRTSPDDAGRRVAFSTVEYALDLAPEDPDVYVAAADLLEKLDATSRAEGIVDAGLRLAPGDSRLILAKTRLSGAPLEAQAGAYARVLAENPRDAEAGVGLHWMLWAGLMGLSALALLSAVFLALTGVLNSGVHVAAGSSRGPLFPFVLFVLPPLSIWAAIFYKMRGTAPAGYIGAALRRAPGAIAAVAMLAVADTALVSAAFLQEYLLSVSGLRLGLLLAAGAGVLAAVAQLILGPGSMRAAERAGLLETDLVGRTVRHLYARQGGFVAGGAAVLAAVGVLLLSVNVAEAPQPSVAGLGWGCCALLAAPWSALPGGALASLAQVAGRPVAAARWMTAVRIVTLGLLVVGVVLVAIGAAGAVVEDPRWVIWRDE